jgi:hypothetical protein
MPASEKVSGAAEAGAPRDEIEVTAEMAEAGAMALAGRYLDLEERRDLYPEIVRTVFDQWWQRGQCPLPPVVEADGKGTNLSFQRLHLGQCVWLHAER